MKIPFREVDDIRGLGEYGAYGGHNGRFQQVRRNGGLIQRIVGE